MNPVPHPGTILSIRDLAVQVQGTDNRVVRDFSLDVCLGETVCIVSESGSGKSVTALAVMGLLPPGILKVQGGIILVEGEDVVRATPHRLRQMRATHMAMVFQEPRPP